MPVFTPNFEKPGPGISKNEPPKKGVALFLEILVREFWQLIKLNLIFFVACIPVVTIGAAISGLSKSTTKMVRDVPNDVWDDFKSGFRENMRFSIVIGLGGLPVFVGASLGFLLYAEHFALQTLCLITLILLTSFGIHFFPLLTSTTLSPGESLRNAFLLGAIRFYCSIPAAVFCVIYIGVQILLFPLSVPFSIFLGFSIPGFVGSFAAWSSIQRYIIKDPVDDQK